MSRLSRKAKKIGIPPGSLIYTGDQTLRTTGISLYLFNDESYTEKKPATIEEALALMQPGMKAWLNINGISDPKLVDAIGKKFKLHPLLLEDIMNPCQRPKLDDYKDYLYITIRLLQLSNQGQGLNLKDQQLSIVLGDKFIITFIEEDYEALKIIRERLEKPTSRMRLRGTDYLAYALLDMIVDSYFLSLEQMDNRLEVLEESIFNDPSPQVLRNMQKSKRELALLRKTIWPIREVINHFKRNEANFITDTTRLYANDVYDHTIQAIETIESFRDIIAGMLDMYLSNINQKMNEIMKVLTVVATIFVPLTFISSLYGMNFHNMPELSTTWGYPAVLTLMALIASYMLYVFHKKKWISFKMKSSWH
jgi:magnesium transporter